MNSIRLWDVEEQKMIYPDDGGAYELQEGDFNSKTAIIALWTAGHLGGDSDEFQEKYIAMNKATRDGFKDYYEYDLVKLISFPGSFTKAIEEKWKDWIFIIQWSEEYSAFIGININDTSHDIILGQYNLKVVGNFFENKDLLRHSQF